MATIKVGSARIDENGNLSGGTAGDQTGNEVSMQTMYTHSKGWYILRPKKVAHATKIASRMKAACNNSKIGYDQNNRLGIIKYGIDTTTATECDCSSLVRQCVKEATGTDPGNFTTATEVSVLSATGLFMDKIDYVSQSSTPVYNGDVLVTKTKGHTVVVVSGNARSSGTTSSSSSSKPSYTKGTTYTTQVDRLRVRKGAGTNYAAKTYSSLTANARKNAYSNGTLKKGAKVTCKNTKTVGSDIWMKIPSGWVAAYYNGKKYVG